MPHYKESSRHNSAFVANLGGLFLVTAPTRRPTSSGSSTRQPTNQPDRPTDRPVMSPLLPYSPPRASLRIAALDLRIRANTILAVPYTSDIRSFCYIHGRHTRESLSLHFYTGANMSNATARERKGMDGLTMAARKKTEEA